MQIHDDARAAFRAWEAAKPRNFFTADPFLQQILAHHLSADVWADNRAALEAFGAECATVIDQLARETNRDEHLPRLRRWDHLGHRTEQVVFHPDYAQLGDRVYRTGAVSRYEQTGQETLQLAFTYLYGHNGEAGHLCPLACTAGLIKILQAEAEPAVAQRFLPGLLRSDRSHPEHFHAAQFLTEIQGGSDVGANGCQARPIGDGTWRISGEKWFCSVIDADLYLLTARPEGAPGGTRGLRAFVVPREIDGRPNGLHIRRLKYKLGTRSMASGEADFSDAIGWPATAEGGFKRVVAIVLNTSRLYNAIASSGLLRRAQIEAESYAAHRHAFGRPIAQFPLVRRSLTRLRTQSEAATAGTFALAALADAIALHPTEHAIALHRLVVNMNKYWTSLQGTHMVREAIEVLGGNGAIEDFSVLPRLLRDSIVLEQWEGTHNVLCQQVLKDLHKYQLHHAFFAHADQVAQRVADRPGADALQARLTADRAAVQTVLNAPSDAAQLHIRDLVDRLAVTWQILCLFELALHGPRPFALDQLLSPA
jgi:alkylation response protein AidB-like acyl-CoA dehydrogenase